MNLVAQDVLLHLNEEAVHTDAFTEAVPRLDDALLQLEGEFSSNFIDRDILAEATQKVAPRVALREDSHVNMVWVPLCILA